MALNDQRRLEPIVRLLLKRKNWDPIILFALGHARDGNQLVHFHVPRDCQSPHAQNMALLDCACSGGVDGVRQAYEGSVGCRTIIEYDTIPIQQKKLNVVYTISAFYASKLSLSVSTKNMAMPGETDGGKKKHARQDMAKVRNFDSIETFDTISDTSAGFTSSEKPFLASGLKVAYVKAYLRQKWAPNAGSPWS